MSKQVFVIPTPTTILPPTSLDNGYTHVIGLSASIAIACSYACFALLGSSKCVNATPENGKN